MSAARPTGRILALNAGSSSLKFGLFGLAGGALTHKATGALEGIGSRAQFVAKGPDGRVLAERVWDDPQPGYDELLGELLDWTESHQGGALLAAGHRVVHGGRRFTAPAVVDDACFAELEALVPLAPLHQPRSLALIARLRALHPGVPQVACFDTAFHAGNPELARRFALPAPFEADGLVRYGFHGLSYEYVAGELAQRDPASAAGRCVIAHLGNGASLCALVAGSSVATTMGFSVLDGLVMGTRCGLLDPGAIIYLQRRYALGVDELEKLLYERSGLLGLSGFSGDMRALQKSDAPAAAAAVDLFVYRLTREAGSMVAAAGGLDAFVFTAGIGERDAAVRARVCARWLGSASNSTSARTPRRIPSASARRPAASRFGSFRPTRRRRSPGTRSPPQAPSRRLHKN